MVIWEKRWSDGHGDYELGAVDGRAGEVAELVRLSADAAPARWALRIFGGQQDRMAEDPRRVVKFESMAQARDAANWMLVPD